MILVIYAADATISLSVHRSNAYIKEVAAVTGKAEWLFRHHKAFCLKKYVLSVRLNQLTTSDGQAQVRNEWIESEAFRSSFMNEYVQNQHFYSPTEMIALRSEDAVRQELINEAIEISKEIQSLEFCINLCDGILNSLNTEERWIITERYLENKTLDAMITHQPEGMNVYSRQTMAKYCKKILDHIDKMLMIIQFPKELYNNSSV